MTISFVAGVMLGVAVLHLLPHGILRLAREANGLSWAMGAVLVGILFMFFLNRLFHFHQHDFSGDDHSDEHQNEAQCDHKHHQHRKDTSWFGLVFGLSVHTLIDGVALAAAVQSESISGFSLAGFSIFIAIVLHKPLDAISVVSLMKSKGWSELKMTIANVTFAMMCPLGAMLLTFGLLQSNESSSWFLGLTLAFSAGVFLCIALGDLLPEVHFHTHDRGKLSATLILGIVLAAAIEYLPGHRHNEFKTTNPSADKSESESSATETMSEKESRKNESGNPD